MIERLSRPAVDREVEFRDEYKPIIRLLSWIPSIMLLIMILSITAEWLMSTLNPLGGMEATLRNV